MGRIVFVGGGIVGTCAAMMLANDGHDVTVLERDPASPPQPENAWDDWDRRGVNQFRMVHLFAPRFRALLDSELPDAEGGEWLWGSGGIAYGSAGFEQCA